MDIRKKTPYEIYEDLNFSTPIGKNGDCYDRYLLRLEEMRQSLFIITQCIAKIPKGLIKVKDTKLTSPKRDNFKIDMQTLITHFKIYSDNLTLQENEFYQAIEAPKGEFGLYLVANATNKPYRSKIKSPGFLHLQGIAMMAQKHLLADVVTIIGTQDIVSGEVDR
jgi:NADH:ubiquinone oxidoreductase subunit D